jgi:hypothetical protein
MCVNYEIVIVLVLTNWTYLLQTVLFRRWKTMSCLNILERVPLEKSTRSVPLLRNLTF